MTGHMDLFNKNNRKLTIGFGLTALALIAAAAYGFIRLNEISARVDVLSADIVEVTSDLSSTTVALKDYVNQNDANLSSSLNNNVNTIQRQLGSFQSQVGSISGTVTDLQKLATLDPELLKKYSKVYFLNENYVPRDLTEIPKDYQYTDNTQMLFVTQALPHLEKMIDDASSTGIKLYVYSAYRSFDDQKALKGKYSMVYGAGTANSFSADQGYSEHQLGTAVDLITPGLGGVLDGFDGTAAYQWLLQNAYKYGFVISYPKGNGYYEFEPWHWRFVGVQLATDLHNDGKYFYDVDQRTLDSYLVDIFN
ncbi:MAG: M15 family metallopeptidase [Patescibacteria group bacterium]|nr:M15 family metallopeptidase [Patescibacteria group bacterium]MDE1966766.1 M15 family metallopeptidase [Patescibacteria group bacterium]